MKPNFELGKIEIQNVDGVSPLYQEIRLIHDRLDLIERMLNVLLKNIGDA
jgi:hypothetical protein